MTRPSLTSVGASEISAPLSLGERATLYCRDALTGLAALPDLAFDLAIVDPPYGASSAASWVLAEDHGRPGFGGRWRLAAHAWDRLGCAESEDPGEKAASSERSLAGVRAWLTQLGRIVRPTGSIWIHATYHNAGFVNVACQMSGLEIINEVIWYKRNAFPNLSGRRLTASHETILWVHTGGSRREYRFNYEAAKEAHFPGDSLKKIGRQLRTVWDVPSNKRPDERLHGRHPTQKPLRLAERLLLIAAAPGGRLLVPFVGSGTEMIAGLRFGMECVGFENDPGYFDLAARRLAEEAGAAGLSAVREDLTLTVAEVPAGGRDERGP
jgi:site-specific DNA-methyltransferase (adenine-specific)